jgi:hypothetical protein
MFFGICTIALIALFCCLNINFAFAEFGPFLFVYAVKYFVDSHFNFLCKSVGKFLKWDQLSNVVKQF